MPNTTDLFKRLSPLTLSHLPPPSRLQSERDRSLQIEDLANGLLEQHPHFRGRGELVRCWCVRKCLYLVGTVPTYYLKQLAQEAIRPIKNVKQIENQIVVANPQGLVPPEDSTAEIRKPR